LQVLRLQVLRLLHSVQFLWRKPQDQLVDADNYLGIPLPVATNGRSVMSPSAPATRATPPPVAAPAAPPPAAPLDSRDADELLAALRSLFACTRRMRSWVTDAGATTVLSVVEAHGEARVGTLAAALHVDVSTVSRSLAALVRDGLVQWRTDERDARSHLVSCTAAGLARLEERRTQITEDLTDRLRDWPDSDVADLSRLLHRFVSDVLTEPAGSSSQLSNQKESA
jgi:DNA-binding MarR family transcriptional regulator